jgi:hypothetical protein
MARVKKLDETRDEARNADPITGAPGAHPVGVGVGAAAGGAVAGAAAGAVGGPVGAAVGAVAGAVAGGYAGKAAAEAIDPTVEDAYWRDQYPTRPYYEPNVAYDEYAPAYRYGWESRSRHPGQRFDDVEQKLASGWTTARSGSRLEWERARSATRDAWNRVEQHPPMPVR